MAQSLLENFSTDTVGMRLHRTEIGLWAKEKRVLRFGNWSLDVEMRVFTEIANDHQVNMFLKITDRLWMYFVTYEDVSLAFVVDAVTAELTVKNVEKYGTGNVFETVKKLRPQAAFVCEKQWVEIQLEDVPKFVKPCKKKQ